MKKSNDEYLLHVRYTEDDAKILDELCEMTGMTKTGIFRLGLKVLKKNITLLMEWKEGED